MTKIQNLEELAITLDSLRQQGKKIVQCHGVFDLLHPGHIHHLEMAKKQGDVLVVSLTRDAYVNKGPGRPVFNEDLRARTIAALQTVDYVCLSPETTAITCIRAIRPDVYAKGAEYNDPNKDITGKIVDEADAIASVGGVIFFTDDEIVFSSSRLINGFLGGLSDEQRSFLDVIKSRYGSARDIINLIKDFSKLKVLLVGDTIIDRYIYCEPMGQSLKYPLVINKFLGQETFCGGVLAIANQLAQFTQNVELVTMLGAQDSYEDFIMQGLNPAVKVKFFHRPNAPTVLKQRYLYYSAEQKIFEVCSIADENIVHEDLEKDILDHLTGLLTSYDLVIVADYGHGLLTSNMIRLLQEKSPFLAINVQTNSANLGYNFVTKKYAEVNFVVVDEAEARLAMHDRYKPIDLVGKEMLDVIRADKLIVTRGKNGSMAFSNNGEFYSTPAFATKVVDRVGAGDAFLAVTSLCAVNNLPLDLTSFIGNNVGALKVQTICNKEPASATNLYKYIETLLK